MKFETQQFYMFTNNNWDENLWIGFPCKKKIGKIIYVIIYLHYYYYLNKCAIKPPPPRQEEDATRIEGIAVSAKNTSLTIFDLVRNAFDDQTNISASIQVSFRFIIIIIIIISL